MEENGQSDISFSTQTLQGLLGKAIFKRAQKPLQRWLLEQPVYVYRVFFFPSKAAEAELHIIIAWLVFSLKALTFQSKRRAESQVGLMC